MTAGNRSAFPLQPAIRARTGDAGVEGEIPMQIPMKEKSAMRNIVFTFALLLLVTGYGLGQSVDPAKFAAVQKGNAQQLRKYSWKQRMELQLKGETKKVLLNQMRYDVEGKQQKTPLSTGEPEQAASGGRRGGRLKAKVIENKKEEFKDMMEGLAALVTSYGHIPPDELKAALSQAKVTPGEGEMQGAAGVHVASIVQSGDSLILWVDTKTLLFRRIEINSSYEQKPVMVTADYSAVSGGPNYMAKAVLQYPAKELLLRIDNFEYQPAH
jgi:hypothetical protein